VLHHRLAFHVAVAAVLATLVLAPSAVPAQRAGDAGGPLRIALAKQPVSPTGTSPGSTTMASGGIAGAVRGVKTRQARR
jgi:hypothetical protein